jgi:hypothetical protein
MMCVKPVKQTIFGEKGNCVAACIASFLHLPTAAVPNFILLGNEEGFKAANRWLRPWRIHIQKVKNRGQKYQGYYIAGGSSCHIHGANHAVIYKDGKPYFDPRPENSFLCSEPTRFYLLMRVV